MASFTAVSHVPGHLFSRFFLYASSVGWVSEPNINTRGTWDLLQMCIITIFFCTATSLHLNIPKERYGDWRRRLTRLVWLTINTLAPEIFMCIAMTQYLEAKLVQRDIARYCKRHRQNDPKWTLTQAFYFNMRGFVYKPSARHHYGRSHTKLEPSTLKLKHLEAIVELGLLPDINVDTTTIKSYAKQSRIAKTVAITQALWLLLQTYARVAEHLPASPLEITAVAYVSVTFFSWLLWFNKPQGVDFSTEVRGSVWLEVFELTRDRQDPNSSKSDVSLFVKGWKNQLPNIKRKYGVRDAFIVGLTWLFTSALFGGLHLLAWNYEFPSSAEKQLWRYSSITIIALPPLFYTWAIFRKFFTGKSEVGLMMRAMSIVYLTARMYNLIEVFYCLRATPPTLYETVQWPQWLPHF